MQNYILHTKINSLTIIHLIILRLFSFNHVLLKLNSATGREDKQTKFKNAVHTFATAGKQKGRLYFLELYTACN